MDLNYELLAVAIIETAVRDYAKAMCILHFDPANQKARAVQLDVEAFFGSGWLTALTTLPGEALLRYAKELADKKLAETAGRSAADRAALFCTN